MLVVLSTEHSKDSKHASHIFLTVYLDLPTSLSDYVMSYMHIFSEEAAISMKRLEEMKHCIDLESDAQSSFMSIYNLSETELAVLREYLKNVLDKEWIQSFSSPADASILFILKKDDRLCLCVDYCNGRTSINDLVLS
ncbi:hypothetical protein I7I48_02059 [Histoplasma ohiense]|nr:hypothetical protein I7I48_02059 [Histoplasma ohiense (nom. inval.)]